MNRVAFLLGNLTDGGSETKTVRMANRMSSSGHDVHVIYLGAPHTLRPAIEDSVSVEFLDRRGKFSFRALRKLNSYVSGNEIDTVFCINHPPLIYGWPICSFGNHKCRCIGAMNTYEFTSLRDRFFMLIYAFILRRCDRVVFGSEAQQQLWTRKYRLRADSSKVIYNGVDVEFFGNPGASDEHLRESLDIEKEAIVIGCVAHFRPEKSHGDLLAAMKSISESSSVTLLLIGEGPEEPRLRRYVETHDLSSCVRFCGRVSDVRPFLALMDIFVLPSNSEVFSNAILEAMAAGLPVVCTAVGGSTEMVVNGETGITYARHDVGKLIESLEILIVDGDKRKQLGRNGAARVREIFSIERMDSQYAQVISSSSKETGHG
jgi:glycosyltransferase involved in cell wall biosynthesis